MFVDVIPLNGSQSNPRGQSCHSSSSCSALNYLEDSSQSAMDDDSVEVIGVRKLPPCHSTDSTHGDSDSDQSQTGVDSSQRSTSDQSQDSRAVSASRYNRNTGEPCPSSKGDGDEDSMTGTNASNEGAVEDGFFLNETPTNYPIFKQNQEVNIPSKCQCSSDLDSLVIIGLDKGNTTDLLGCPGATWCIGNTIYRQRPNTKSRILLDYPNKELIPHYHHKRKNLPLQWFPNIAIGSVEIIVDGAPLLLHINLCNLGRGYITKTEMFTNKEIAVVVIALEVARLCHSRLPAKDNVLKKMEWQDEINWSNKITNLQEFQAKEERSDSNPDCKRCNKATLENCCDTTGAIFMRFFFEAIEVLSIQPEVVDSWLPASCRMNDTSICSETFHSVAGLTLNFAEIATIASQLHTHGMVVAQHAGCKDKHIERHKRNIVAADKKSFNSYIQAGINHFQQAVKRSLFPTVVENDESEASAFDGIGSKPPHAKFPRNTAGALIFYDAGFNVAPFHVSGEVDRTFCYVPSLPRTIWLVHKIMSSTLSTGNGGEETHRILQQIEALADTPLGAQLQSVAQEYLEFLEDEEEECDDGSQLTSLASFCSGTSGSSSSSSTGRKSTAREILYSDTRIPKAPPGLDEESVDDHYPGKDDSGDELSFATRSTDNVTTRSSNPSTGMKDHEEEMDEHAPHVQHPDNSLPEPTNMVNSKDEVEMEMLECMMNNKEIYDRPGHIHPDLARDENAVLDLDAINKLFKFLHTSSFNKFSKFCTNGAFGGCHTGKIKIQILPTDDGRGIRIDLPESLGRILGMQCYSSVCRRLGKDKILKNTMRMMQLPRLLMELVGRDPDKPSEQNIQLMRKELAVCWNSLVKFHNDSIDTWDNMKPFPGRMEFFMLYKEDVANDSEKFESLPHMGMWLRAVEFSKLQTWATDRLKESFAPLKEFMSKYQIGNSNSPTMDFSDVSAAAYISVFVRCQRGRG